MHQRQQSIKKFTLLENKENLEIKQCTKEESEHYNETAKKIIDELKLNFDLINIFGFGIGFFYPIVHNLVINMNLNIEVTDKMIVMLTICVFSILFKENKKDIKKLLEEIRMNGTYGVVKSLLKAFESIKDFFKIIFKNLGKSITSFVDIFSYAALFIPCSDALNKVISVNHLDLKSFINHFVTIGIGAITIVAKNYITDFIKKLNFKIDLKKFWDFFKIKGVGKVKKFNEFEGVDKINEIDTVIESQKYLIEIENA